MGTDAVATIFSNYTNNIRIDLTINLPLVLGIAAGLISLGVLIHYVRSWIQGKAYSDMMGSEYKKTAYTRYQASKSGSWYHTQADADQADEDSWL